MRRKKIKLQNLDAEIRANSKDNPPVFRGVVAHVNGYTQPSLSDLHALIVGYGGGFQQYLDGKTAVTHIIASNLTPKKKTEFARYRIVQPQWVIDSVRAGKLQPWDQYRVVDEGTTQKILGFDNGQIVSQANTQTRTYRDQTQSSWYTQQLKGQQNQDALGGDNAINATLMLPPGQAQKQAAGPSVDNDTMNDSFNDDDLNEVEAFEGDAAFSDDEHLPNDRVEGPEFARRQDENFQEPPESPQDRGNKDGVPITPDPSRDSSASASDIRSPGKKTLTAEEHNAILLADPRMRKSSTVNPDFLKQYYQESRLHHLSTWKAELKAQLQALTQEKSASQRSQQKRKPGARRYIMHVDFDCFFAAVSLRKHPELIDKPVVVAHGTGSGSEIASCNYPARAFGVKNGMWMKTASNLCPDLKVLPYDYKAYEEASRLFYESILASGGIVQSVSIDEALVDITTQVLPAGGSEGTGVSEGSIFREQAIADEIAQNLRTLIKEKTGCAVSVGIGANILLAKVALRKAKPAGQHQIKPEEVLDFLGDLTVQDLPGVAYSIGGKLEEIGIKFVKDIRGLNKERLINTLGPKTGEKLWDYSRGIDKTEVGEQVIRKSVSAEVNWGIRFVTQAQADEFVQSLCEELSRRLLEQAVKGRQLTMKIMRRAADAPLDPPKHLGHGKCDTFNKSVVLGVATNSKEVLGREALSILKGFAFSPGELRGLGVQMTKLEPLKPSSTSIFDSSQKRLQFKQSDPAPKTLKDMVDTIEDIQSPENPRNSTNLFGGLPKSEADAKPLNIAGTQFVLPSLVDPSVLAELPEDIRSSLAPKPKPVEKKSNIFDTRPISRDQSPGPLPTDSRSRSQSPFTELPSQSQIDPETLAALPEDVQAELRAYYAQGPAKRKQTQQLLPQSPRKARPATGVTNKLQTTPTKKKITSLLTRGRPSKTPNSSTLTQSAFVSTRGANEIIPREGARTPSPNPEASNNATLTDVSPSFLEALPPDIRAEILAQQRQERMKAKSGLSVSMSSKTRQKAVAAAKAGDSATAMDILAGGQRTIKLPPRPEKPSFTSRKLTDMNELREAIKAWVEMFREPVGDPEAETEVVSGRASTPEVEHARRRGPMGVGDGFDVSPTSRRSGEFLQQRDENEVENADEDEDGPYDEDIQALSTYLARVIKEENDFAKATDLVKWLAWCVDELVSMDSDVETAVRMTSLKRLRNRWDTAVLGVKTEVTNAASEKGVKGILDFA